jgi:nucleoside-diphosphate-sugar epimerase
MKSVLIIGSGLLGLSLAEKFSKNGYDVSITTTSENKLSTLRNLRYNPIIFNSNEIVHYENLSLLNVEILVFALPPSKCEVIAYNNVLMNVCDKLNSFNQLVFTSSVSVYSNNGRNHSEESEAIEFDSIIYITESYIKEHIRQYYIFRLAGLIDLQRHPKNFHKNLIVKNSRAPVNLVHIQDVSNIVYSSITQKIDFGIYNLCSTEHPTKEDYYGTFNHELKFSEGEYRKTVEGSLISNLVNYNYTSIYDF